MGFFNKTNDKQANKTCAADIFAERNKQPAETAGDGVEDRILGYSTLKGAEAVKPKSAPVDRIAELRKIRDAGKKDIDYEKYAAAEAEAKADAEGKLAATDAINARKNLINSANLEASDSALSAAERAAIEAKGMATLDDIVSGIKNKQFLTEVADEELGEEVIVKKKKAADDAKSKSEDSNLSGDEILARTAAIRNKGFFTETEIDEAPKPISAAKKLEQDLEELEYAENAISSYTNIGFRKQALESDVLADTDSDMEEDKKEEGDGSHSN